jgi:hypothetical protein
MKTELKRRVINEIPKALFVNAWGGNFVRIEGDPVHPDKITSLMAATRILRAIKRDNG